MTETTDVESAEDRLERALVALQRVIHWCEAYPINVFPEPGDISSLRELIGDDEMCRLHASWARHLLSGIAGYAKEGL